MGFVDPLFFPELFKHPPDGLHKVGVHGFIIVIKIDPTAHAGDGFAPFADIGLHHGTAFFVKHIHPGFHNRGGTGQSQSILGQRFDGQTVTVPAKTTFHILAAHGLITRHDVFDGARQQVTIMRQPGGKRRAVVEHKLIGVRPLIQTLLENAPGLPKREHFFFVAGKIDFI